FVWGYVHDGSGLIERFFRYQVELFSTEGAGHGGPVFYHVFVLGIGCFPASALAVQELVSRHRQRRLSPKTARARRAMIVLMAVVLCIFSVVKTKIVHYTSLAYLPLSFL